LVVRTADKFRQAGIDMRTGHRVERIDTAGQAVTGSGPEGQPFQMGYDRLLIATGASPIIPKQPGFDLPGVVVVKTLEDGRTIKAWLQSKAVRRILILGMGYIAMEMSEALRERDIEVVMAKPRAELLPWLDLELAGDVRRELIDHKVELHTGFNVDRIEPAGNRLKAVAIDGQWLEADMVIVAIGVRPNSALAMEAGLRLGPAQSIAVDRRMCTSHQSIYAAGDCADAYHVVTGQKAWIPLALRANRAGWAVADHLFGKPVSVQGVAGTGVFKVFDLEVARTGLIAAAAGRAGFEPATVTITARSRAHAHPGASQLKVHLIGDKRSGRLLGAQMVGHEGAALRINAAAVALHAGMTVEQFSQSDLAYAPPFGPTWDPLLVAANQLLKAL
jgi:NADPH-dependent 2,4-dienoyl-CoA reductase/sulfur reductase-like enzyme